MSGYTPREFADILVDNGWCFKTKRGSHATYYKTGHSNIITIPCHGELCRPMAKRLLKEAGIE
jgi:predicted RNA binding protein YcfA (HicA-like mRNA interferase family)